jgi:Acyltransferase
VILDDKGGAFASLIKWYIARKLRGAFRAVWGRGELPSSNGGLLVYANHSSFWDGFLMHELARVAGWDGYAMMEEANLAKYPFHTRVGAFSVSGDPKGALGSIRHAKRVLGRPGAALCIFPEGELRPGYGSLGPFRRGLDVIAKSTGVRCLPVALRYAFLEHEHPDVLIEFGATHAPCDQGQFTQRLGQAYEQVLAARSTDGFTRLIAGRSSVQERWDAVRGRRPPPRADVAAPPRA